jgi:hypothetical protein
MALPQLLSRPTFPGSQYTSFTNPVQASQNLATNINSIPQPPTAISAPSSAPAEIDPYTQYLQSQQAQQNAASAKAQTDLQSQIRVALEGLQGNAGQSVQNLTDSYGLNNRNLVQSTQAGQQAINTAAENNALNLRRSMAGIADTIRQGVKSGGVQLANMNAGDSGATEALSRAYARLGNQQTQSARNQAALTGNDIAQQQSTLDLQRQNGISDLQTYRKGQVDSISNDLYDQLKQLDASANANGTPNAVNFGIRDQFINDAIAKLNAIDQQTTQGLSGVGAETPEQIATRAAALDVQGQGANPFQTSPINSSVSASRPPAQQTISGIPLYYKQTTQ